MAIVLFTPPYAEFQDDNGNPLSGGKVYTYLAGTTTPQATYTDQGGGTPNANPVPLDSSGRAAIWLDNSVAYKFVVKTSADVTIRTVDNVTPFNSSSGLSVLGTIAANTIVGNNTGSAATPAALTVAQTKTLLGVPFSGSLVQTQGTQTGTVATGTTVLPNDNTIPQNTEGDQYMSVSITPTSATNILYIDVVANLYNSAGGSVSAALFQDTTANALAAMSQYADAGQERCIVFTHKMTAGTTSSTTFKVRGGGSAAGTTTFNGRAGTQLFGGVMASSIYIREVVP